MDWGEDSKPQGEKRELLVEGTYIVDVDNVTCDLTKEVPMICVTWKFGEGKNKGRLAWQNFYFRESAMKWLTWQLGLLGAWSKAKGATSPKEACIKCYEYLYNEIEAVKKQHFELEVKHETYNGVNRAGLKIKQMVSGPLAAKKEAAKTQAWGEILSAEPSFDKNEEIPW